MSKWWSSLKLGDKKIRKTKTKHVFCNVYTQILLKLIQVNFSPYLIKNIHDNRELTQRI